MERKKKLWIAGGAAALVGAVALAGIAHADREWGHGMWGHGDGGGMARMMMERYDANKDGSLSQDEINTNRTAWHGEFDKDKSGDLSIAEFEALWLKARHEEMVREFQRFDRDGDGKVTLEEYKEPLEHVVAEMDTNGDGVINKEDRMRRHRHGMGDDEKPGQKPPAPEGGGDNQ